MRSNHEGSADALERLAGMTEDDILVTEGLSKSFGDFRAVSEVSLRVKRGAIHALIGPNGAGKTTCFNMLTKFIAPSAGTITFNGRDITAKRPADVARLGPGPLLPDLGGLSQPHGARKRAHRARAGARRFVRLLALEVGA